MLVFWGIEREHQNVRSRATVGVSDDEYIDVAIITPITVILFTRKSGNENGERRSKGRY